MVLRINYYVMWKFDSWLLSKSESLKSILFHLKKMGKKRLSQLIQVVKTTILSKHFRDSSNGIFLTKPDGTI